jgi:hypothetical protein
MADQRNVNILLVFRHSVSDYWNYEFLDRLPCAIPQVIKTLSFGEFCLSSIKDWEYTFRPVLLIRKPTLVIHGPFMSFCDTEVLFPKKWRGNQLRAG